VKHFFILFTLLFLVITFSQSPVHAKTKDFFFSLSPKAQQSVNVLAKNILTNGINPQITTIKPQLDPGDYVTVKNIGLLPDNSLYFFKNLGRNIQSLFTFDQVGKIHQKLKISNQKTLEALLLIEKATKQTEPRKHNQLISLANSNLESVGSGFDDIRRTIVNLTNDQSPDLLAIQDEAFRFASQYLKHQVLLQQQEDKLNNADFLSIESTRVRHLASLSSIVVSSNHSPETFSELLVDTISPQVGSNYSRLSVIAILRDLENYATPDDQKLLQTAQSILRKEFEVKFSKLSQTERLQQVKRYVEFIHGNPIREFQAYNLISKSFTSKEMKSLTTSFKDRAAQNFKSHLVTLDNEVDQRLFIQTLFGNDPVDLRLVAYTEIQLQNPKVLGINDSATESAILQKKHLQEIKTILGNNFCQTYGKNADSLEQTRFFSQSTGLQDVLDLRVSRFLTTAMQSCTSKSPETSSVLSALTTKLEQNYINQAIQLPTATLPDRKKAKEILQEEQIETQPQDEQKVAEQVNEEIQQIEDQITDKTASQSAQIIEDIVTVIDKEQTIIEEVIQSDEPTPEEIIQKEEQIVEEIIDSAEAGETSPLVNELPAEVQEEITQTATPTTTPTLELTPTPTQTVVEKVIEKTEPTTETVTTPTPTTPIEPTLAPAL